MRRWCFWSAILMVFAGGVAGAESRRVLLVVGDSLTAGYGLERPDTEAYPARLQERCDQERLGWKVVGAGVSGDTSAGGLRRIDWLLRQKVDGVIIALGANDGLRGIPPPATQANLEGIVRKIRQRYPAALLWVAGMEMPTNLGPEYVTAYRAVFPAAARAVDAKLIPFLLAGVGGVPELNQADGIHPTVEGQARIAATVWAVIAPDLRVAPRGS